MATFHQIDVLLYIYKYAFVCVGVCRSYTCIVRIKKIDCVAYSKFLIIGDSK